MQLIVLIFGCLFISYGKLPAGSLFAALLILPSIRRWYSYITRFMKNLKQRNVLEERVLYLYEKEEEKAIEVEPLKKINVENLSFSYDSKTLILDGINISIQAGEKLIISGQNGTGKTTLLKLIAGLYEPKSGRVMLNVPSMNINKATLRTLVSYCSQESYLFHGTLLENVCLGLPDITADQVKDMLASLGLGKYPLDDIVEEGGNNYSSGEKQKILLARSLLKQTNLLLLDEPTNHIDMESQEFLVEYIKTTKKAVILISHNKEFIDKFQGIFKELVLEA